MDARQKIDYSGRTVDLLLLKTILKVPALGHRVRLDAGGDPMIVSGIEKMVQRYAVAFLNALGSTKFRSGHGTRLIPEVAAGRVYDMSALTSAAAAADLLAKTQIMESDAELPDTPDDERLTKSEIIDLEFDGSASRIRIEVELTSAAGDSYVYIIPVDVGVHQ